MSSKPRLTQEQATAVDAMAERDDVHVLAPDRILDLLDLVTVLKTEVRKARSDFDDLVSQSGGVYGLHLNGDPCEWSELLPGGQFEEWTAGWFTAREATDALEVLKETKEGA